MGSLSDITLSGHTDIRLPTDADEALRGHENGHDRLNKWEYERRAKQKIEDAVRDFVGSKFKGVGANDSLRKLDAEAKATQELDRRLTRADSAIVQQMFTLSESYDDFTDHGQDPTCSTAQGEAKAKEAALKAPESGGTPLEPDDSEPGAGTESGDLAYYDGFAQRVAVTGPGLIQQTTTPGDPIVGRGRVLIEPFIHIGLRENGSVRLADTRLWILDQVGGDTLMTAYLLEPAYLPTGVPGYVGMVQAYLSILPPEAGGIQNTIGSPFLADLDVARELDAQTTVWVLAQAPLFGPDGACTIPPGGVPVAITLGVGLPVTIGVGEPPPPTRATLTVFPRPGTGTVHFAWKPVGAPVDLEVFDVTGTRRWAVRLDGARGQWTWQGRDDDGRPLHAGVYFARLHGGGLDLRSRVVLAR